MASESMLSSVSNEQCKVNTKLSESCDVSIRKLDISDGSQVTEMTMKALEKRDHNSYRNLPGLIATASSVDIDRNLVKDEVFERVSTTPDDTVNADNGKRERICQKYEKLLISPYIAVCV